jgi:hypothetical protein
MEPNMYDETAERYAAMEADAPEAPEPTPDPLDLAMSVETCLGWHGVSGW